MWTVTDSWKVKRLRRNSRVIVQACDRSGKNLRGEPVAATAEILDAAGTDETRALIRAKYGVIGWVGVTASSLRRGKGGTVGIKITPA